MLKSLSYKNFQCHEKGKIVFDRITTIVGPSDAGKTAIFRMLYWLMLNRPRGEAFIRHGTDLASVTIRIADKKKKHKITRRRGKDNVYKLGSDKYSIDQGGAVPETIRKILNVSEENFQRQLDAPYWFDLSPGEVSRALNEIVNLEQADRTLTNLASDVRETKTAVSTGQDELRSLEKKRETLKWVSQASEHLKEIEAVEEKLEEKQGKYDTVKAIAGNITKLEKELKENKQFVKEGKRLGDELEKSCVDKVEMKKLWVLIQDYKENERYGKLKLPFAAIRDIDLCIESTRMLQNKVNELKKRIRAVRTLEDELCQEKKNLKNLQKELSEMKNCPLCGSPIKSP